MRIVSIHSAKAQLSCLVEAAAAGEEIVITKYGKPIARLCSLVPQRRQLGRLNGKIRVPDDFDRLYEEEIRQLFEDGC
jgi:prevent-host-death family protein